MIFDKYQDVKVRLCHRRLVHADIVFSEQHNRLFAVLKNKVKSNFNPRSLDDVNKLTQDKENLTELVGEIKGLKIANKYQKKEI